MSTEDRSRAGLLRVLDDRRPSTASTIHMEGRSEAPGEEITIVLTQAYCPNGHNLIQDSHVHFDGQPGIRLRIGHAQVSNIVTLSPIHGDARKQTEGAVQPALGARLTVVCPECGVELPLFGDCVTGDGGQLRIIYLTPRLDQGHIALVCDIWGCPHSQVLDEWSVLSEVVLQETADADEG